MLKIEELVGTYGHRLWDKSGIICAHSYVDEYLCYTCIAASNVLHQLGTSGQRYLLFSTKRCLCTNSPDVGFGDALMETSVERARKNSLVVGAAPLVVGLMSLVVGVTSSLVVGATTSLVVRVLSLVVEATSLVVGVTSTLIVGS